MMSRRTRLWTGIWLLLLSCSHLPTATLALDDSVLYHLEEADPSRAILFPWVVQCVGVCVFFLLTRYELPLPYAAVMFLIGTFMGLGAVYNARRVDETQSLDQLSTSILQWSNINSAVLLLVFLPGLIFRDAIEVNFNMFMASLSQILILAFPMVLVGTFLTALVGYYVIPYDWPLSLAATLGAILASTDPVAVGSVLKKAGAPPRLQMLISGESLLNDGSAVVFFTIFSQQYLSELGFADSVDVAQGFATFFRMAFGGVAVGIAFAIALLFILYELDRRLEPEYNVLQVVAALTMAYLSYYVSEQVCICSGVIACVVCGIVARALGRGLINDNQLMDSYLSLMEYLLNTLLFTLGGVVWGKVIADGANTIIEGKDFMYLLVLYLLVMVIRLVQVALFFPVFSRVGLKSDWKEAIFLCYGGLRGAVGVALALSLNRSVREVIEDSEKLKATETLEFLAGGVTFMTLFINGTTAGPVLRFLGLSKPIMSRKRTLQLFQLSAKLFVQKEYQELVQQKRFKRAKFAVVREHVLFVSAEPECHDMESEAFIVGHHSTVEPSIRLINAAAEGCPEETLVELRQLFLELLNEAYRSEVANCELDEREDNGYNIDVLRQSVAFTTTGIEQHHEPINDWEYTENFTFSEDVKSYLIRKFQQVTNRKLRKSCTYEFQQRRTSVLKAIAFIEAHRRADRRLKAYVESIADATLDEGDVALTMCDGLDKVLEESAKQVAEAQVVLNATDPALIDSIVSHYVSSILLRKAAKYIEESAADGILTKKEARAYLDKVDQNLQATHTCTSSCGGLQSISVRDDS